MCSVLRKLTEREMAKRRAEMMAFAQERDVERESNVKRYRDDDAREVKAAERIETLDAEFVKWADCLFTCLFVYWFVY